MAIDRYSGGGGNAQPITAQASGSGSASSGSSASALSAFRSQYGRDPTAAEIANYRATGSTAALGGSAAAAPSAGAVSGAAGSNARITTNLDMSIPGVPEYKPVDLTEIEYNPSSPDAVDIERADSAISGLEDMIGGLREKNKAWLEGRISGDTADQLRSQAALGARAGGAGSGSPLSRNLQARDFGMTSMQIQQQGMQQEGALSQLQQGLAGMREQRMQFMTQLREQQSQYGAAFGLDKAKVGEASRQFGANLQDQMYRTQLAHKELMLKQEAFNAEQNMRLVELISSSTLGFMQLQTSAAGSDVDFSGGVSTFDTLQRQIEGILARSNPA